jgi:N-methylhydantoinase B
LADGTLEPLPSCAEVVIGRHETIVSISGGGGGYGEPRERDPVRVLHDVREGWISSERAKSIYGLSLTD